MVNLTILAGGYTSYVASYVFDTDASTLSLLGTSTTGDNPSWITLHPKNSSILYAVNENTEGAIQSFTIGEQGVLTGPVGQIATDGNGPAFTVALSTGQVAAPNYGSGNARIIPTSDGGLQFNDDANIIYFGESNVSHPHMAYEFGVEILVPDLGEDKIWRLTAIDNTTSEPGQWEITGSLDAPTGSGPRHMAIYEDYLYCVHELASTITAQPVPSSPPPPGNTSIPVSAITANLSTVPENNLTSPSWAAAEIQIPELDESANFSVPLIYTSNRNTGTTVDPRGDTIAIFEITDGGAGLQLVNQVYTGLQQVRGMIVGGPNNEYIVASGYVGTGGVAVFKRTEGGFNLEEVARNTDIATRTSFIWGDW